MVRAFRYITFALEQDPWDHAPPRPPKTPKEELKRLGLRDTSFVPTDYILMLNGDVHGIVPFFEIAGNIIFHFIDKVDIAWMEKKLPNSNLWKGSSLFTMDRWEFWKDRLRWIGQKSELMERTREDAERLIRIMQNIQDLQSSSS
ncbi:hypothetical protein N7467_001266 [Penicillium canescens]|nr:hypothetical protein N7467_001266 [Penicillium canescens]